MPEPLRFARSNGPPRSPGCETCHWEVRDSDLYCSFCGELQRRLELEPSSLTLGEGALGGQAKTVSAGEVTLTNVGPMPVYLLGFTAPDGITLSSEPPLGAGNSLPLPFNDQLTLRGNRSGPVGDDLPPAMVLTSIGLLEVPIELQPAPEIRVSEQRFKIPHGRPREIEVRLTLETGHHAVELKAVGPGLRLLEPFTAQMIAARMLMVTLEVDASSWQEAEQQGSLFVDFGWTEQLVGLSFERVEPARLIVGGGIQHLNLRVFPGDEEQQRLELKNPGTLPYLIERLTLTDYDGNTIPNVEVQLLDEVENPVDLAKGPLAIPPAGSRVLQVTARAPAAGGAKYDGTLTIVEAEGEELPLAATFDSTEPPDYERTVGFDFGTSASCVATRKDRDQQAGYVESVPFVAPKIELSGSPFLPSDIEVSRDPRTERPTFRLDWKQFSQTYHLAYARNLKRRIGLRQDFEDRHETVFVRGRRFNIPAEELATFVVREMKRQAERHVGRRIRSATATMPSRFSLRRSQAIQQIYLAAGFDEVVLVDEAIAAGVLGMYNQFQDRPEYTMLVYDMGAGTTDVTLCRVTNRRDENGVLEIVPEILGSTGDPSLGGRDVTDIMVEQYRRELPPAVAASLLWPGPSVELPEHQLLAKRNRNDLFLHLEEAKLRLFEGQGQETASLPLLNLWPVGGKSQQLFPEGVAAAAAVQEALRPRLERLWRQIEDLVRAAQVESLDILFLAGRSSQLPIVRRGLWEWLTRDGRHPKLEPPIFPVDREGRVALKQAVSLGASLIGDLLHGVTERLLLPQREAHTNGRLGLRNPNGSFTELLPAGYELNKEPPKWLTVPLVNAVRKDSFDLRLELWETFSRTGQIDGEPDAEFLGVVRQRFAAEEVNTQNPRARVGIKIASDRSLRLLIDLDGDIREVPVGS